MPFKFNEINGSPSFVDYEYEIVNKGLLAEYVAEMLLGHHLHILRIIRSLSATFPVHKNESIDQIIVKIKSAGASKRDGWLFQMISWIVLAKSKTGVLFFSNYPHFAPAQHGIDGLAIILNPDDTIENIIITEDKCTANPRNKIVTQVFPEFKEFEKGSKDNALVGIISSLIGGLNAGEILEKVQNDIFEKRFRLYRIGITREASHNSLNGRKSLFLNYNKSVDGVSPIRRSAASIHIEDMREWMSDFADQVIVYLESKKSSHVQ